MVKIDKIACIGCGTCVAICPEVFEMGKDSKARVKEDKDLPCVREAIDTCPAEAIEE